MTQSDSYPYGIGAVAVPTFPALPGTMKAVADVLAAAYNCPRDYVIGGQLAALSASLGTKYHIAGRYDNWPCLWIACIGRSGSNKSAPIEQILKPLRQADALAAGEDDGDDASRRLFVGDSSHTALREALRDSPAGLMLYRDELTGFLNELGKESGSVAVSELLTMFNQGQLVVDRHNRAPYVIPRPYLTILGGLQPRLLGATFGQESLAVSGFAQRFLFIASGQPGAAGNSAVSRRDIAAAMSRWEALVNHCLAFAPASVELSREAQRLYDRFYATTSLARRRERSDFLASVYSKQLIQVVRIAGIAQVVLDYDARRRSATVGAAAMRYAISCMPYFEATARRVEHALRGGSFDTRPLTAGDVAGLLGD